MIEKYQLEAETRLKLSNPSGQTICRKPELSAVNVGRVAVRTEWSEIQLIENIKEVELKIKGRGLSQKADVWQAESLAQ